MYDELNEIYDINIKFVLGPDIAYIYPDFKTVLRGEFKDEKVIKGQICFLIGSKIERGICIPTFTKAEGQVYEFEEPGRKTMAKNPLVPEPWEATLSYVKQSNLDQAKPSLKIRTAIAIFWNYVLTRMPRVFCFAKHTCV